MCLLAYPPSGTRGHCCVSGLESGGVFWVLCLGHSIFVCKDPCSTHQFVLCPCRGQCPSGRGSGCYRVSGGGGGRVSCFVPVPPGFCSGWFGRVVRGVPRLSLRAAGPWPGASASFTPSGRLGALGRVLRDLGSTQRDASEDANSRHGVLTFSQSPEHPQVLATAQQGQPPTPASQGTIHCQTTA